MIRTSVKDSCMNVRLRATSEAIKEVGNKFGLQITDQVHANFCVDYSSGTSRKIYGRDAQCFVHGHDKISGAQNAALIAQRLSERLPQRDADIFYSMVLVNVEISDGSELQIECTVIGKQFQHVIEEADAGRDFVSAFSFNREPNENLGFFRDAINGGFSHRATCWRMPRSW